MKGKVLVIGDPIGKSKEFYARGCTLRHGEDVYLRPPVKLPDREFDEEEVAKFPAPYNHVSDLLSYDLW